MKPKSLAIAALLVSASLAAQHSATRLWETDSTLKVPESVCFDGQRHVLYVSNIDGKDPWGKDGQGSVGKVGLDGKIIKVDWVSGLNAPKGIGIHAGKLYVADLSDVVVIDIAQGKIDKKIAIPGAQNLNDVSVGADGAVYVSDSKLNKIFRIQQDKPEVYVDDLKGANGVLQSGNDFYFVDAGAAYKLNADKSKTKLADGMEGGTDGIEKIGPNDFLVSCWQGALWYVKGDGSKELLFDGKSNNTNTADIGYDPATKTVYVPTFFRNSIIAFSVK